MRIRYEAETDTLSIVFSDTSLFTHECAEGVDVHYDGGERVAQVVIHKIVERAAAQDVFRQIVLEGIGPPGKKDPVVILPRLLEPTPPPDDE